MDNNSFFILCFVLFCFLFYSGFFFFFFFKPKSAKNLQGLFFTTSIKKVTDNRKSQRSFKDVSIFLLENRTTLLIKKISFCSVIVLNLL